MKGGYTGRTSLMAWSLYLTFSFCPNSWGEEYPLNEIQRPLTFPAGTIGLALEGQRNLQTDSFSVYPKISYGFTDSLELLLFGVRYSFYRNPAGTSHVAASARISGFGNSTVDGTFYDMEAILEGKMAITGGSAVTYRLQDIRFYRQHKVSQNCSEIAGGFLITLSDAFFFIPTLGYQTLSGFGSNNAAIVSASVKYNRPAWDVKLQWTGSDKDNFLDPESQTGIAGKQAMGITFYLRF